MQQLHPLQRPHHHLEMHDALAVRAAGDDVDAVDADVLDRVFELEDRAGGVAPFANVAEARSAKGRAGPEQIFEGDLAPALRRVDDRAFEDDIGVERVSQKLRVVRPHIIVPPIERDQPHRTISPTKCWHRLADTEADGKRFAAARRVAAADFAVLQPYWRDMFAARRFGESLFLIVGRSSRERETREIRAIFSPAGTCE